ncbi:MAG: hypothetical protein J6W51_05195 [Fibrobacter sp.]|nr:hypothetical protein [Fibrobacter sp.]
MTEPFSKFLGKFVLMAAAALVGLLVACSSSEKASKNRNAVSEEDRKAKCQDWLNSLTPENLITCHLEKLGLDERLDSLLFCAFGQSFKMSGGKVFCTEEGNEFSFSLTGEKCESGELVCVQTTREKPNEDCKLDKLPVFINGISITLKDEGYLISSICGDFGCDDYMLMKIDDCGKKWLSAKKD